MRPEARFNGFLSLLNLIIMQIANQPMAALRPHLAGPWGKFVLEAKAAAACRHLHWQGEGEPSVVRCDIILWSLHHSRLTSPSKAWPVQLQSPTHPGGRFQVHKTVVCVCGARSLHNGPLSAPMAHSHVCEPLAPGCRGPGYVVWQSIQRVSPSLRRNHGL